MKFKLEDYGPIDYRTWILGDKAREGANIKKSNILTSEELKIWDESIKYQDQRNDPGQGEIVTYFVIKLLNYLKGKREVAVPAAILHDTGFYGEDPTAWKKLVNSGANTDTEEHRRPHQNRGCLIAGRVLENANYPEEYHNEIADIIGDHDTRKLPTTDSGKIVRAADLLWRVTYPCVQIYLPELSVKHALTKLEKTSLNLKSPHTLGETEKQIARIELANTLLFKFGKAAHQVLQENYLKELNKVLLF
ncbi:MAG: hypothetical protein KJ718_01365 [Nanoarchaeota archaeon]|nr:hypothetical protein [Nanoarchaeota archaeon]MBU1051182.1 hypothetical protein [Nanoarchaeota archaeon]MBU1988693.1 hypothetical protein [Nanoarchaeota archaeon]